MIKLDSGNVLLKPTQRKQVMSWLKRAMRLGEKIGSFRLNLSLQRTGKFYEVKATAQDSAGNYACRARKTDWKDAFRELARMIVSWLHQHRLALGS